MNALRGARVLVWLAVLGCGGSAGVPGSGVEATQTRALDGDFDRIEIDGTGRIEVTRSTTATLEIAADDNLLPLITHRVADGRLLIRPSEAIAPKSELVIRIQLPALKQLTLRGSAAANLPDMAGDDLAVEIQGAGTVKVAGSLTRFDATVNGAGSIEAGELAADTVAITLSGAGKAEIRARKELAVVVNGVGRVRYHGSPQVSKTINGLGSVERAGD